MTLSEFSFNIKAKEALLKDPALRERLAIVAANAVTVLVKRRVFSDGIAQDGSPIGKYSTKEGWFQIDKTGLPKISPKSKRKGGKPTKTYYSESGYAGYRKRVGRQSAFVDLKLTGGTFNAVGTAQGAKGLIAFGIRTELAKDIIEGNELRFDCVTVTPNEAERQAGRDAAIRELKFILGID